VLSDLTKDLHMHLKLCLSTINNKEGLTALKNSLSIIIHNRSHLTRQQFGDVNDYEITREMTERDKKILTESIANIPVVVNEKKQKVTNTKSKIN
jgi:hypothetical protein